MRVRLAVLLASLVTGSCASAGRVRTLEARVAGLEQQAAARDVELRSSLMRVEAQLAALMVKVAGSSADELEVIADKLDSLEARIAQVAARPPTRPARPAPDPTQVYAVPITGDPFAGRADALVTIVRAGEYACPFCEKVRPTLDQLLADYPRDVRIVYKDFIVHPQVATDAALAACAAHRQGKFREMDTLLWERAFKDRRFELALYETLAVELGLDLDDFRAAMKGPCPGELAADQTALGQVGVGATPVFFINGRYLAGAQPYAAFKSIVDEELARAKARLKQGAKRARYYDEWVIKPGLTKLAPPPAAP